MATIQKTVRIPPDHRVKLDLALPDDIPPGNVEVLVIVSPLPPASSNQALAALAGCLADSPIFAGDPVALQREWRDGWK